MILHQLRRHLSTQRRLVTWHQLSTTFEAVVASPSRISKTALLSSCFRDVMATDIHNFSPSLQLTLGSQKLGIGAAALRSSAAQFLNLDLEQVEERVQAVGDLAEAVTSLWQQNRFQSFQHLSGPDLKQIPWSWGNLSSLEILDMSNTGLITLPYSMCGGQSVDSLSELLLGNTPASTKLNWTGQLLRLHHTKMTLASGCDNFFRSNLIELIA